MLCEHAIVGINKTAAGKGELHGGKQPKTKTAHAIVVCAAAKSTRQADDRVLPEKRLVAVCAFSRIRCAVDDDRAHRGRVDKKSGNLYDHADLQSTGRSAGRVSGRTGRRVPERMKTKKKNKEEKSSPHQRVRIFSSEKQGGFYGLRV